LSYFQAFQSKISWHQDVFKPGELLQKDPSLLNSGFSASPPDIATISVAGMPFHLALVFLALAVSTLGAPVTTAIMTTVIIDVPQVEPSTASSDTLPAVTTVMTTNYHRRNDSYCPRRLHDDIGRQQSTSGYAACYNSRPCIQPPGRSDISRQSETQ
jgi:hypothetical protein